MVLRPFGRYGADGCFPPRTLVTAAVKGREDMKALRFYAPEDVRLQEVPEPQCAPEELKIRVRTVRRAAPTSRSSTTATRT